MQASDFPFWKEVLKKYVQFLHLFWQFWHYTSLCNTFVFYALNVLFLDLKNLEWSNFRNAAISGGICRRKVINCSSISISLVACEINASWGLCQCVGRKLEKYQNEKKTLFTNLDKKAKRLFSSGISWAYLHLGPKRLLPLLFLGVNIKISTL